MNVYRRYVLLGFGIVLFGAIFVRLWTLQISHGTEYAELSRINRIRNVPIPALRGRILDRTGIPLADNGTEYRLLWMLPATEAIPPEALERTAALLGISEVELEQRISEGRVYKYEPATIARDLTYDEVLFFEEKRADYPELAVVNVPVRTYPGGRLACHVLGYLGEISPAQLEVMREEGYRMGDVIGQNGLERTMETHLHGLDGAGLVEVNSLETKLGVVDYEGVHPAEPGLDVYTTIDVGLQTFIEPYLEGIKGAIIVMDPENGDVWALASSPGYDPRDFVGGVEREKWIELATDPNYPLLNRAVQSSYPPGSTFKLVTATAALESGLVKPDERMPVPCYGVYRYGRWLFHCWKPSGHGPLTIAGGLKNSCNVFFFQVGHKVGIDNLEKYSRAYLLGEPTGIDLPGETGGMIPERSRLEKRWGDKWPRGEVLNNAIGQGQVLLSPIQELSVATTLANGGYIYRPRLVRYVAGSDGSTAASYPPEIRGASPLSPEHRAVILQGMMGAVGRFGANEHYLAGKTGSAENPHGKTHAWFVGMAPVYDPQVTLCIFIENGGYGESYIKWGKAIVGYCRANIICERNWPEPPPGVTPKDYENSPDILIKTGGYR
jgi:penicillin-binding protein 2